MGNQTAKIVREKRKTLGLSQEDMARKLGVSINYISLIENGKKKPGNKFIKDFSSNFNVPLMLFSNKDLLPEAKTEKEKELLRKFEKLMSDMEELFLSNA